MRSHLKNEGWQAGQLVATILIGLSLCFGSTSLLAQTDLPAEEQANLIVEISLGRLRAGPLGEFLKPEELLGGPAFPLAEFQDIDWSKIDKVRLSVRLPRSVSSVMEAGMNGGDLPLQFSFVLTASGPDAFNVVSEMIKQESEVDQVNGKDVYRPRGGPGNVGAVFPDDRSMAVGTDEYLTRLGQNVAGDGLLDLWKGIPDSVLRIAGDLKECENLFIELQQMGAMAPPEIGDVLEALPKLASLAAHLDFESEHLLTLKAASRSPDSAKSIKGLMEHLSGMIRAGADDGANAPPAMKPMADMMQDIADGTKVSEDSKGASLVIATPNDFAKRVREDIGESIKATRVAAEKLNDLKQVCLSMHNYYDTYRRFPQSPDPNSKGKISWRVRVLPYLEEVDLYDKVDFDQDADSAANRFLADKMPKVYGDDGRNSLIAAVRAEKQPASFQDITDGTSNTIAFVRLNESIPWATDRDVSIEEVVKMFEAMNGEGMVIVAMYDGSVRNLPASIPADKLRALLTPDGGENIDF